MDIVIEREKEEINLNNNENNETLFWKLFHNKYIRNYIFNQITVINKTINKRTGCEINKFKDITSLGWLIRNKQLSLLKCKLERDDEKVVIEKDDILLLLNEILSYSGNKYNYQFYHNNTKEEKEDYKEFREYEHFGDDYSFLNNGDQYKKGDEYIEDDNLLETELREETKIFKLILSYKLNEIMEFKLIDIIMDMEYYYQCELVYENVFLNQLLFNEPYCNLIKIDEKTIELVIKSGSTKLLKNVLLNLKNRGIYDSVINDNVKNNSISWVGCVKEKFKDYKNKDEMYEFILNDESLYNVPQPISESNKRLKSSKSSYVTNSTNNEDDKVVKIDVYYLFKIDSPNIQNKLLKLNYFKIDQVIDYSEDIVFFNNNNFIKQTVWDILVLFTKSKGINEMYSNFLMNYDEPIDGLEDLVVWQYTLFSKSLNCLKYLLSKYKHNSFKPIRNIIKGGYTWSGYFSYDMYNKKEKGFQISSNEDLEFIKLYTTNYHYFPKESKHFNYTLLKFIFSIQSNQEYEMVNNNSIVRTNENKKLTDLIPEKWFDIPIEIKDKLEKFREGFLIQDTNTIDLIFNGYNYIKLFHDSLDIDKDNFQLFFKYETYQLIDYAKLKYGSDSMFFKNYPDFMRNDKNNGYEVEHVLIDGISSSYYIYPFTVAINNCDIESLKHIDQILNSSEIDFYKFHFYDGIGGIKYSKIVRSKIHEANNIRMYSDQVKINFYNNNEIISNTNQINELLDYFGSTSYKLFSSTLFIKFVKDLLKLPNSNDFKISFQFYQNEWFKLFSKSITNDISSNFIRSLLNYNPFKSIESLPTNDFIDKWKDDISNLKDKSFYKFIDCVKYYENFSIKCLYYALDDRETPFCCYSYESSFEIISSIELILNQVILIKHCYNKSTTSSSSINIELIRIYDIFQFIINHLFKRLIKVHKVTEHQIQQIYQHIKSTWLSITNNDFIFEHSKYHVFFYLGIRSIDFMNCLMSLNYIVDEDVEVYEYLSIGTESQNFLDPTKFTFDYIFNYSYDDILKSLQSNIELKTVDHDVTYGNDTDIQDGF